MALGATLLHLRIHPLFAVPLELAAKGETGPLALKIPNFFATLLSLLDLLVVTLLFTRKKTAASAFLINGMLCIYGTIFMAHFAITNLLRDNIPLIHWPLQSTLADIVILGADFLIGMTIYKSYVHTEEENNALSS